MAVSLELDQMDILQSILTMAGNPLLLLDAGLNVLKFSNVGLEVFPLLKQGRSLADCFSPADLQQFTQLLQLCQQESAPVSLLITHQNSDEAKLLYKWQAKKILGYDQELRGYCLLAVDQTYKAKLEAELKKSIRLNLDQKKALDESAIVAMTDHLGIIHYVNDTFCRISGYDRSELLGQTHALLKSGFHPPEFFKNLWKTISSGQVWKGEIQNKSKSGETYCVDTTIVPFLNEKSIPYQYVAIRFDVTEKKWIQEKLEKERMRGMYAEKMASLGELAAGIAHELGNPAASINAWLEVMESQYERGSLDLEIFMQAMPRVKRDAKRMRDIIRGMLTYARDGSRDPFQSEGVEDILQQVVEYCGFKLRSCAVTVKLVQSNPYLTLDCRISEISQLLVNFILNACDAVQNLDERWIEIEATELANALAFIITDSGLGIPDDVADKIFQPFFTTKAVGQGTGLGLSIARSIIDSHSGKISLDRDSKHTRFIIELPKVHINETEK